MNVTLLNITEKVFITSNFVGKVSGSTVENPHNARGLSALSSTLQSPNGTWGDIVTSNLISMSTLDGGIFIDSHNGSGNIVQTLFSFNLIESVDRKYGAGTVQGAAAATRVAWLKANVTNLTANWHGFGSGPAGNKANLKYWNAEQSTYAAAAMSNTAAAPIKTTYSVGGNIVDANGFVHFLAYADASNGTIASTINTDYVELIIDVMKYY